MRICFVTPLAPEKGGTAGYSHKLIDAISKDKKHYIYVLAGVINKGIQEVLVKKNVQIIRIMNARSPFYPLKLFREILRIKPDIVHSEFGPYGLEWGGFIGEYFLIFLFLLKIFRIPNTLKLQNLYMRRQAEVRAALRVKNKVFTKMISIFYIAFTKLLVLFCDLTQILSNTMNSRIRKLFIQDFKLPARKIFDFPNCCDNIDSFDSIKIINMPPEEAKNKLEIKQKFVLLCFGWIYPNKGIEFAIEALKYLKNQENILLIIAGQTHPTEGVKYIKYIKNLIVKMRKDYTNINIKIINRYISNEEVNLFFNAADIVLQTYTENYGASGPLHQAASYGKPVIAFNTGYHWIDGIDHTVILCPNKDEKCIAKKIDYFYENFEKLVALKEKIINYSKEENWTKAVERTINYYKLVLKKFKR